MPAEDAYDNDDEQDDNDVDDADDNDNDDADDDAAAAFDSPNLSSSAFSSCECESFPFEFGSLHDFHIKRERQAKRERGVVRGEGTTVRGQPDSLPTDS